MRKIVYAIAFAICAAPGVLAAQTGSAPETTSLRDQLMPAGAALTVTAPAPAPAAEEASAEKKMNEPVFQRGGRGTGYMIAGAALLVAGLLIDDDAGTLVAVAGAAIGAYGLYIHFR